MMNFIKFSSGKDFIDTVYKRERYLHDNMNRDIPTYLLVCVVSNVLPDINE